MNIINNGEKIYEIAAVEANKKYRISFELDGQLYFQIGVQKNDTIKRPVTKPLYGVTEKYTYVFSSRIDGMLCIEIIDSPSYNNWTAIHNIVVEEA